MLTLSRRDRTHALAAAAQVRGAALAIAMAAMGVREQTQGADCDDHDVPCLTTLYVHLVRQRERLLVAARELARIERTPVPHAATPTGAAVPTVQATRDILDTTNDLLHDALTRARTALVAAEGSLPRNPA